MLQFPALVFFLLNIVFPGIGTISVGVIESWDWNVIFLGLAQGITSIVLVGWIWSIVWGYGLYMNSTGDLSSETQTLVDSSA